MRVILVLHRDLNDAIFGDLYIKGEIIDKLEAIHVAEEIAINVTYNKEKNCQIHYKDFNSKAFRSSNKLMTCRNLIKVFAKDCSLIPQEEFKISERYLRAIKHIAEEPESDSKKIKRLQSPPPSPRTDITLEEYIEKNLEKQDSGPILTSLANIYSLITGDKQNSDSLTDEMRSNIAMLISIGFLEAGSFYIKDDKAILYIPIGHAYGDFLTNRHEMHMYKRDGLQYRHIRLSISDIS